MKHMIYASSKGKRIEFDDFVREYDDVWTQICPDCLAKYKDVLGNRVHDCPSDEEYCGVRGCNGTAKYYVDFSQSEVKFGTHIPDSELGIALREIDEIEDDEFIEAEHKFVYDYCRKKNFKVSKVDKREIDARGLGESYKYWKANFKEESED